MKKWIVFSFILFLFTLNHTQAVESNYAGLLGKIRGQVLDEATQNPLQAVNIMVDGAQLGTASDENGNYIIERIPPGIYRIRFMMMGYKTRIVNNVVVNPNKTTWQQIELKSTVLEGEDVVVTAGYFHEAKDAVVSNRSVDYEEIRMDPGSVMDIQRVVQVLPAVVSGSDQENEIIVRGGMPGENLFIMDNIEIPNPNHFGYQGAGGGPINMINTLMVRRVDFYAGAFPARYGDKASSVLDIALRDGNREKISGQVYLGMSGAGALLEGPIGGGKGSYILSGQKSFLDLIISSTGLTAVPHYYSLQGKLTYDLTKNDRILINGIYGNDEITIEDDESGYGRGAENVRSLSHQYAVGGTWRHLFGDKGFSRVTLSQTLNYWNQYVYNPSGYAYYKNVSTEIERTLKAEVTFLPFEKTELNFGGQIKSIPFDLYQWSGPDTLCIYDTSVSPPAYIGDSLYYDAYLQDIQKTTMKAALFGQVKQQLLSRLTATLGLRFDYFDYTGKHAIDPRLGLTCALTPVTNLNLAYGQHSQTPAYIYVSGHPLNKNLDYYRTQQVVLGVEHLFREDIRGTLEIFYKDYQGVPVSESSLSPDPFDAAYGHLINKGEGYARGIEVFLQKKRSKHHYFTISYSYSNAKAYDPRYGKPYPWDYDYRHVFTFVSGLRFDLRDKIWYQKMSKNLFYNLFSWILPFADQVEIGIRWRYLGGRPYTQPEYIAHFQAWIVPPGADINTERYPAYHRLDIRLDRRFMFKNWNMVTFIDIMNVYARDNIWMYAYQSDGTIDNIYQFQVFPVGGITIEF